MPVKYLQAMQGTVSSKHIYHINMVHYTQSITHIEQYQCYESSSSRLSLLGINMQQLHLRSLTWWKCQQGGKEARGQEGV